MDKPKVTIGVSAFNSESTIENCVISLLNTDYPNKEIIVVDDGSTDSTLEKLIKYNVPELHIISQNHAGVSAARNNIFRHAKGEIIAYTDSDCEVDKNWLSKLIEPFSDPLVGAVTGKTIFKTDQRVTSLLRSLDISKRYQKRGKYVALANGTNCAIKKSVLEQIGGFDPKWYHAEDTEVSYRILNLGYKIYFEPNALVYHVPEGDWKVFLKKRYRGAKAHIRILAGGHTKNVLRDDFVSFSMKLQPVFYSLSLLCCVLAFFYLFVLPILKPESMVTFYLVIGTGTFLLAAGLCFEIPLLTSVYRETHKISSVFKALLVLSLKSVAIGAGVWAGLGKLIINKAS